jgi:RimJ/RimL family protein N-acetyltransferase
VQTERLVLRKLTVADAGFVLDLLNQPSFMKNIGDRGVRTIAAAEQYIRDRVIESYERLGFGMFAVELKADGGVMGLCGLVKRDELPDVDIGFAFLPQFWSKGYAAESAAAIVRFAFDRLALQRLVGIVNPDNFGSIKVLEKIGLCHEGMITLNNESKEICLYATKKLMEIPEVKS